MNPDPKLSGERAEQEVLLAKSQGALKWPEVLLALSARAESEPGKRECLGPELYETAAACEMALVETGEMVLLFERGDAPPATPFREILPLVETARAQGVLEPLDLIKIADLLQNADAVKNFFSSHREQTRLGEWAARLDPVGPLRRALFRSLDHDGSVLDTASAELHALRKKHDILKERIHRRLSELVTRDPEAILQDNFYTQRGQRYVVPVKAAFRKDIEGIVHDTSASGQTVFVEPAELVEPNNQLRLIEAEIEAEVRRILRELSEEVGKAGNEVITDQQALTHLDGLRARARLALDLRAHRPQVNDRGRVRLFSARHPLLLLRRQEAVANDLHLGEGYRVLVVSGPNAGGKTVGLTMLGLFALMTRAGMFIPAGPDSEMAVFTEVYAVIGDEQDLSRDLSSFSAHLGDLSAILPAAGDRSLVLLDELMNSTDPGEGAALASAFLAALRDRGATVMATTHFPSLKSFAHQEPGFQNASYAFDPASLKPTYQLLIGMPGRSLGLEMAGRLGLPKEVIARARGEMDESAARMESLLGEISARLAEVNQERLDLAAVKSKMTAEAKEYSRLREEVYEQERELKKTAKAATRELIKKAELEIENLVVTLRKKPAVRREDMLPIRDQLKNLQGKIESEIGEPTDPGERPDWSKLAAGHKVAILPLLMEGELLEVPANVRDETKVKVRMGKLEVMVEARKVRRIAEKRKPETVLEKSKPKKPREVKRDRRETRETAYTGPVLPPSAANTLDLRGQRLHEAETMVEHFLDRACREHRQNVFIIHGHGTEALKRMVRETLGLSPYVETFRPGEKGEGGDGVTMVQLKEWGL